MKPGHPHNTRFIKRKVDAQQKKLTAADIQNRKKVDGAKHVFPFLETSDFAFLRACKGINNEWGNKKAVWYRNKMIQLLGRPTTEEEQQQKSDEIRYQEFSPYLKAIHSLSNLSPWNIFATCSLDSQQHGHLINGRLWYLPAASSNSNSMLPFSPYAAAAFLGLSGLANRILNGWQFTNPQAMVQETKDDLLFRDGHGPLRLNTKKDFTVFVQNRTMPNGKFDNKEFAKWSHEFREQVVFDAFVFFLSILTTPNLVTTNLFVLMRQMQVGSIQLYQSTKRPELTAWHNSTLTGLCLVLETKLIMGDRLESGFAMIGTRLKDAPQEAGFRFICAFLNSGVPINIVASDLQRAGFNNSNNEDVLTRTYFLISDLIAAFAKKDFASVTKHFTNPKMQSHIPHLKNWNYKITTPGQGPLALPTHTIATLEAYAHRTECTAQFNQFYHQLNPSTHETEYSMSSSSSSSSSARPTFHG